MRTATLSGVLVALLAVGCGQGGPTHPLARISAESEPATTTSCPPPSVAPAVAVSQAVADRIEAMAQIPAMRSHRITAIMNALAARHPKSAEAIGQMKDRLLGLTEVQIKALRAGIWNQMKDKTVEQVHRQSLAMIDDPDRLLGFLDKQLDALEELDTKAVAQQAATLPEELERLEEFHGSVAKAYLSDAVRRLGRRLATRPASN